MSKRFMFLCVFTVAVLTACSQKSSAASGTIVYQVIDRQDDSWQKRLVVADVDGKTLREVELPGPVLNCVATFFSNQVICFSGAEAVYLVNAQNAQVQTITLGENAHLMPNYLLTAGQVWLPLATPKADAAWLLNLRTAETISLKELAPEAQVWFMANYSPDGRYILLRGDHAVLVPVDNPRKAIDMKMGYSAAFTSDSKNVIYLQHDNSNGQTTVIRQPVDGSAPATLYQSTNAGLNFVYPLGDGKALIAFEKQRVFLLDAASGKQETLESIDTAAMSMLRVGPDGQTLLIQNAYSADVPNDWTWIDVRKKTVQPIDALVGQMPLLANEPLRWWVFSDSDVANARHLIVMDMQTGQAEKVLTLDEAGGRFVVRLSPDQRLALAYVYGSNTNQIWLINLEGGKRYQINADYGSGSFSPDSRWAVVSLREQDSSGENVYRLYKVSTQDGKKTLIGSGINPVWVAP